MNPEAVAEEGFVPFRSYDVWYRRVGKREEPGKLPPFCLRGRPWAPHDFRKSLVAMAATGCRAVLCDLLGCGTDTLVYRC